MKYVLVKNVPLKDLFLEKHKGAVLWSAYGFKKSDLGRLSSQGNDSNGDYAQVLPLDNETVLNNRMDKLQELIDTNTYANDSIEIIEEAAADIIKADIIAVRNA